MAASFLVEEFEDEQAEHGAGRRNHARAGIAGRAHEAIEAELSEQRQKQEESGQARAQGELAIERQQAGIGTGGLMWARFGGGTGGASARRGGEKGGVRPWRMQARN